jgi:hypothetical protein
MSVKKRSQIGYKETLKNITNDKTVTTRKSYMDLMQMLKAVFYVEMI